MDDFFDIGQWNNPPDNQTLIHAGIAISFGTGGARTNFNVGVSHKKDDFKVAYGFGATYHSDFYETGKHGWELRNSLKLDYETNNFSVGIGTNFWDGKGQLNEFDQRTGMISLKSRKFSLMYENDGSHLFGLGDGGDSYRTAALSLKYDQFSLNTNLLTGRRDEESFKLEDLQDKLEGVDGGKAKGKGKFGETYEHGHVYEQGTKYRYGGLTLNYRGLSVGANSEWIRQSFQNKVAHDWIMPQRQFPMLSNDWKPILNFSNQGTSEFTTWGQ